jgi:hypothetical protein
VLLRFLTRQGQRFVVVQFRSGVGHYFAIVGIWKLNLGSRLGKKLRFPGIYTADGDVFGFGFGRCVEHALAAQNGGQETGGVAAEAYEGVLDRFGRERRACFIFIEACLHLIERNQFTAELAAAVVG